MNNKLSFIVMAIGIVWGCTPTETAKTQTDYLATGDSISAQTFSTMAGVLKNEIANEGIEAAIEYCRAEASGITSTMANNKTVIRRSTLKPRNPANAPDPFEQQMLEFFQSKWEQGESLVSLIQKDSAEYIHYFKPIILQPLCMGCHGEPERDISLSTLKKIQEKYPADKATGYKTGDLRGIWHITFKK